MVSGYLTFQKTANINNTTVTNYFAENYGLLNTVAKNKHIYNRQDIE